MGTPNYSKYLKDIVNKKGKLAKCFSVFHDYSIGNQILAISQLDERNEDLAPIAPYKKWLSLGRQVKKGSKALELLIPISYKKKDANGKVLLDSKGNVLMGTAFSLKNRWFTLDQTEPLDGTEQFYHEEKNASWDAKTALDNLLIIEEKFQYPSGNCQGYAKEGIIAINPVAQYPHKTRFHEIAHNVLGHCSEGTLSDDDRTPKDIKEVEAESVAYILCQVLGLSGAEDSRGYVQHWLLNQEISDKSAAKIFSTADKILKAGQLKEVV